MPGRSWKYSPTAVGITFRMKMVGPATKTRNARIAASTMLMLDSHWMPRSMPETAEATNAQVSTAMMTT